MAFERLQETDPVLSGMIDAELARQRDSIELIASENFTSPSVMEAVGSVLTNKYAEGYPGRRITADASGSTRSRTSPGAAPASCTAAPSPTSSPIRARTPTSPPTRRSSSRATRCSA